MRKIVNLFYSICLTSILGLFPLNISAMELAKNNDQNVKEKKETTIKLWDHLGDSLSDNVDDTHKGWQRTWIQLIAQRRNDLDINNLAHSGWGWVTPKETVYKSIYLEAQNIRENTQFISIFCGINDIFFATKGTRIGTIEEAESADLKTIDPTDNTTCTALMGVRKTLDYLRRKFPSVPILIMSPIDYELGFSGMDESKGTLKELREGIEYFSNKYGCIFLDHKQFQPAKKDIIPELWSDGIHPNQMGQELISRNIEMQINL